MRMVDLIEKKAAGQELNAEEIHFIVDGFTTGDIPDYQMSAFMMAVVFQDMTSGEAAELTLSMMHSGDVVDLSDLPGVKVDKHSTGGVGDTTTLVVAPLVAACGGTVAKMSGRGLGHTGGTLDKLESIPGVNIEQSMEQFKAIVKKTGVAVIGQSGNLDPADKKMYALRDVTATVRSIPLIAASIMSKKLAAGADAIVLDVKTGTGAFMQTVEEAERLAKLMVHMGKLLNRRVVAIVTDMNQPLGTAVGNALEVREAIEVLSGKVPEGDPLFEVCMLLGAHMLLLSHLAIDEADAKEKLKQAISSGKGLHKLAEMIAAEGGDPAYVALDRIEELCRVKRKMEIRSQQEGYLSAINAEQIGTAAQMLGAGRATKEDRIDPAVGLIVNKRLGQAVKKNDVLYTLYINDEKQLFEATELLYQAVRITAQPEETNPMVYAVITE